MKYIFLLLFSASAMADEWVITAGGGYLPDHPKAVTVGIKKNWDRKYYTVDIMCYDKCRPSVGFGWYLIKDRQLLFGSTYYLSFGPELKPSDHEVGTVFQFSTKVGVNFGPVAVEVRHGSNASAVLGKIFGDVMAPNQGINTVGLTYRREI